MWLVGGVGGEGEGRGGGVEGECGCACWDVLSSGVAFNGEACWLAAEATVPPSYASVLHTHNKLRQGQLQNIMFCYSIIL